MEHDIPFGNSNRENGPTFLDFPLFLGILQWDEPTKRVPFTPEPEIPRIFYQSGIPFLLSPKFPGFFPKWKAPLVSGNDVGVTRQTWSVVFAAVQAIGKCF